MESTITTVTQQSLERPQRSGDTHPAAIERCSILGARYHSISLVEAVHVIGQFVDLKTPRQVCLSNAYTMSICRRDTPFKDVLNRADLLLADGMSIVWGARWVGVSLPGRVAGPDLMKALCVQAAEQHHRIFLLGSTPENLESLSHKLQQRVPGLEIAGVYSPPMCDTINEDENNKILKLLDEAKPDILFVGLSAPKQDMWIARNLNRLHVPVSIGVGAAFDFLSGRIPRAPYHMQKIGLEWLYRLSREPRRLWKRYLLGNAIYLTMVARESLRLKSQQPAQSRP